MLRRFKVTIRYREPTYERATGPKAAPYRWTYDMLASDGEEARRRAIDEFRSVERQSGVSWTREIEGVDVN